VRLSDIDEGRREFGKGLVGGLSVLPPPSLRRLHRVLRSHMSASYRKPRDKKKPAIGIASGWLFTTSLSAT
jgi:hypothetical protein